MDPQKAIICMLDGLTAADASRRQVIGMYQWYSYVAEALRRSPDGRRGGADVTIQSSEEHRGWKSSAEAVIAALDTEANAADQAIASAEMEAARAEAAARAADADAADAAALEDAAGAAGAAAEAAGLREQASAARIRAEESRYWLASITDARALGDQLVKDEHTRATRIAEAIRVAGGLPEVYGDKHAFTTDGGTSRQLALRGGSR